MNEFAGPLAQGVIDQFCSSSLFVTPLYPPRDPRPPLSAGLGPTRAPLGSGQGSPETWFLHTVLANINIFKFGADNEK